MSKTMNARVIQKHDTEANWKLAVNFIPKIGEIIVYDVDSTHLIPRFKIGDGKTLVSNLPFCTGVLLEEEGTDSIPFVAMAHLSDGSEVEY